MNNEQKKDNKDKKGKKIILPPSVEEKMKESDKKKEERENTKPLDEIKQKLEKSEEEIKRLHKEYMLLQAEFSNFQKRQRKFEEERAKYALQPFVSSLLSHVDAFEHALATDSTADAKTVLDGFLLIYNGLSKVFTDFNVKPITPSKGEVIDLEYHEVMLTAEEPDLTNNTVLNVIQKGYILSDRVIRPAKVIAVKNPEPVKEQEKDDSDSVVFSDEDTELTSEQSIEEDKDINEE